MYFPELSYTLNKIPVMMKMMLRILMKMRKMLLLIILIIQKEVNMKNMK